MFYALLAHAENAPSFRLLVPARCAFWSHAHTAPPSDPSPRVKRAREEGRGAHKRPTSFEVLARRHDLVPQRIALSLTLKRLG